MAQPVPQRLVHLASKLRECQPEKHPIRYTLDTWESYFPNDPDLLAINQRFGSPITRGDITSLGKEAQSDSTVTRRFAMAVMMWGYGTVGYGAHRTNKMLAHPEAIDRLIQGAELIRNGDLADACLFFRSHNRGRLEKFSWSFFTKLFYFVGAASGQNPMPLILDGINRSIGVAGGMQKLADDGDKQAERAMQLWWQSTDKKCAEGYQLYVELVNSWAHSLDCKADAIEMALWQGLPD